MANQHFRAGVAMIVRHPHQRLVMAFERADAPGQWQLPQGGLEGAETPEEGAWRELGEETGLGPDHVHAVAELLDWLVYEWPADVRDQVNERRRSEGRPERLGQVQKWFLFEASSPDVQPVPDGREFRDWRWVDPEWLIENVVAWRRDLYERVLGTL